MFLFYDQLTFGNVKVVVQRDVPQAIRTVTALPHHSAVHSNAEIGLRTVRHFHPRIRIPAAFNPPRFNKFCDNALASFGI